MNRNSKNTSSKHTVVVLVSSSLTLLAVMGCGTPDWQLDTAPVSGVVTLDGKPLKFGYVRFFPSRGRGAEGKIRSDGTFEMTTYDSGDGASLGQHRVVIVCREGDDMDPNPNDREGGPPPVWLIPRAYGKFGGSGLTYEVQGRADNEAVFDLSSKGPPAESSAARGS